MTDVNLWTAASTVSLPPPARRLAARYMRVLLPPEGGADADRVSDCRAAAICAADCFGSGFAIARLMDSCGADPFIVRRCVQTARRDARRFLLAAEQGGADPLSP